MIDLHLLGEVLLQPFVFFYILIDELYRQLTVDFDGGFTRLAVVEPCLRPPPDAASVGIDTHQSRYVETLDVYLQFGKRVYQAAAGYGFVIGFFFTASLMVLRNI